jgi:hypothetical protein
MESTNVQSAEIKDNLTLWKCGRLEVWKNGSDFFTSANRQPCLPAGRCSPPTAQFKPPTVLHIVKPDIEDIRHVSNKLY